MNNRSRLLRNWRSTGNIASIAIAFAMTQQSFAGDIRVEAFAGRSSSAEEGVIVRLEHCGSAPVAMETAVTGPDGKCVFSKLKPGKYCLRFTKVGYNIIVPSCECASPSKTAERIHVFQKKDPLDATTVAWILRLRADGDSAQYAADVATLRTADLLDTATVSAVAAANSRDLPRTLDGKVQYEQDKGPVTVVARTGSESATYKITDKTVFADANGRLIEPGKVTPNTRAHFILSEDGRKVVTKVILEDSDSELSYQPHVNVMAPWDTPRSTTTTTTTTHTAPTSTTTTGGPH